MKNIFTGSVAAGKLNNKRNILKKVNHLYSKEGLWYIWVYLLETDDCKAVDYVCTISIRSADGEEELNCRCRPLSLDLTKENIAESGRGLVFTDTTARLFWQDNKVRYKVVIDHKRKTESSNED